MKTTSTRVSSGISGFYFFLILTHFLRVNKSTEKRVRFDRMQKAIDGSIKKYGTLPKVHAKVGTPDPVQKSYPTSRNKKNHWQR